MASDRSPVGSRGRCQVDDNVSQSSNALQAVWPIEVGKHGAGAVFTPKGALLRVADQSEDAVMAKQTGQDAAGDITATDDQKFLHCAILPD